MKTAIVGMGNTLFSDDGVGIVVTERLAEILRCDDTIEVHTTSWGGFRIIDLLSGYDRAIIIDAVKTGEVQVGCIRKFTPADIINSVRMVSFHDINFATALKFAQQMNIPTPEEISIYAIEVENIYTISERLTAKVQAAVEICIREILRAIDDKPEKRVVLRNDQNKVPQTKISEECL